MRADGTLRFDARAGDRKVGIVVEPYVTSSLGDAWTVTVGPDFAAKVEKGYR